MFYENSNKETRREAMECQDLCKKGKDANNYLSFCPLALMNFSQSLIHKSQED